ncbi:MAG: hypothetical protein M1828_001297 [Chrysothrix sp. TS-e1954]|nr:MAG: hypothetical protein M1828_001297 [Chrysothrix sp. TS-e1954]
MPPLLSISSLALISLLCTLIYKFLIHPVLISPLGRIPAAHPTAPFSPLWILWIRHQFRENKTLERAHARHGPVVRLGPNELSINCVDGGLRTIYAGGYEKHEFYSNQFANYNGVHTMFSTTGSVAHAARKRMMTNVYSKSQIQSSRSMQRVSEHIVHGRLLPLLRNRANENDRSFELDAFHLLNCATMDFVTGYMFGLCNSSNFLQNDATARWWLEHYQSRKQHTFWPQELPRLSDFAARWFGLNLSPKWVADANADLERWTLGLVDSSEAYLETSNLDEHERNHPEDAPTVYRQLRTAMDPPEKAATAAAAAPLAAPPDTPLLIQLASEMHDQLSAGHETSAITLTYLLHELALHPAIQTQLHSELLTLSYPISHTNGPHAELPPAREIDALPFLHAVLTETLRLHAAIPGPQPRLTPSTPNSSGVTLGAYGDIPAGVRVSCNAHCLHRVSHVYPKPETWDPTRWLSDTSFDQRKSATRETTQPRRESDATPTPQDPQQQSPQQDQLKAKQKHHWPFSSGSRMCIGSHLATQNMKTLVASILSVYEIRVGDDAGMQQEDAYTARPVERRLVLRFERRD